MTVVEGRVAFVTVLLEVVETSSGDNRGVFSHGPLGVEPMRRPEFTPVMGGLFGREG